MVVGARHACLILGFSHTQSSLGFTENGPKMRKYQVMAIMWTKKCLVDAKGQRRMARPVWDDRNATVTQITTCYNWGIQKSISECTTHQILKQMGYSNRRAHRVLLLSAKSRKLRLQFAWAHQNWTQDDWKKVVWSDESRFLLQHSDGMARICRKQHKSIDPSCIQGAGVMCGGYFLSIF